MTSDQPKRPGEVVSINGGPAILNDRGVNEGAVRVAEWLLKAALSGEIVGIAAATAYADGGSGTEMDGDIGQAGVIGSLTKMAVRLASR